MKKTFFLMGMAISLVIALMGVLVMSGAMAGSPSSASGAPSYYSSGYSAFGGDAYTYMSNNAQEAASAARTVANNQRHIYNLIERAVGILLIGFGLLGFCFFGALKAGMEAAVAPAPAPAPASGKPEIVSNELPDL